MNTDVLAALGRRTVRGGALLLGVAAMVAGAFPAAAEAAGWYAADLHVHSTVSADARPDLGIIAKNARAAGLNAAFLTDHNQASDFSISSRTANNAFFDAPTKDNLARWTAVGATQVASPVHSGTASTHLVSTGTGEQYLYSVRGPNFRAGSGAVKTTFSMYPASLGAGGTVYVSASFGGDVTLLPTLPGPEGYTPAQSGVPSSCKSVVFVWYFGSPLDPARYQPTATACKANPMPPVVVKQFPISASQCDKAFTLNTWNTCTIDVDAAVATLAAADKPYDYLGLSQLKVATRGPADVYFDDYATAKTLPAGSTVDSRAGAEFAARNALIPQYDDPAGNFRMFPSLEEGTSAHAQRFNFAITAAGQYTTFCNGTCNYASGVSGIAPTQASGYPAQLNHPGVDGGVTDAQANGACPNGLTPACGADVMEVRQRNMLNDWDTILKAGSVLIGDWGSDNHTGSWSGSSLTTFLYAPTSGFDDLMHALFEGRAYDARLGTTTSRLRLLLNLGTTDPTEPYPARYPLYVPTGQPVNLRASITGIKAGTFVRWVQDGVVGANESPTSGTTYAATRQVTLTGSSAYARVEVGASATTDPDGTTQAIMLKPAAAGVPAGTTYRLERVTAPSGQHVSTKTLTKGITASSWDTAAQALSLTLTDQPGSLAELRVTSATGPTSVSQNGTTVTAASSLAAFQAATGASWFYDGTTTFVKAPAATGSDTTRITYGTGGGADTTPPTAPGTPSATSVGTTTATISWTRSTDNVGVAHYDVRRNGAPVGTATQPASGNPTFADSGLTAGTTYSYVVTAVDAAGNQAASPAGPVTTAAAADTTPPSKPAVTAVAASTSVTLTWPRATDNVAVSRYDIVRGAVVVGTATQPASGTVTFTESGLTPSTSYSYVVRAVDAAGNFTPSDAVPVTTTAAGGGGTTTLTATADAKVDASLPTTNFGTVALRVDASPDIRSYVKFDASGLTGAIQTATLRIWTTSAQSVGFDVFGVSDSTWTEPGITYANQPSGSISAAKLGSSGATSAGAWKEIDVKAQITGAGTYSFLLSTSSATALAISSREDTAHAPQLVVTTG